MDKISLIIKKITILAVIFGAVLSASAHAEDAATENSGISTTGLGVEYFHDRYREPSVDVYTRSDYGSVTGYYSYEKSHVFGALDGRVSYGSTDYKSPSGTESGIPEWEFEGRGRFGYSFTLWGGAMSPYTGIGVRYFMQEGKGLESGGSGFYDRRIFQTYLPIGASYAYTTEGGWTITPQAEFDLLLYGNVNSRLANVAPIFPNVTNKQTNGYGARGEVMMGKAMGNFSWQVGPFVRYWDIQNSNTTCDQGVCGLEPKNNVSVFLTPPCVS